MKRGEIACCESEDEPNFEKNRQQRDGTRSFDRH